MFYENDELLNIVQVIKAFKDGKTVECKLKDSSVWDIVDLNLHGINTSTYDYRMQPEYTEKKTRPMTFEEIHKWWKSHRTETIICKDNRTDFYFAPINSEGFIVNFDFNKNHICLDNVVYDAKEFFEHCTKEDGTKFEVEE